MKREAVIVSGYFNPLHVGHLELFENASSEGAFLIVIVNSDLQRELKGSKEFMSEDERLKIIKSIKGVGSALISIDKEIMFISGCAPPLAWSRNRARNALNFFECL